MEEDEEVGKPQSIMEYALLEVPIPGTRWVIPFAVGGMIIGGLIWVIVYNMERNKGNI